MALVLSQFTVRRPAPRRIPRPVEAAIDLRARRAGTGARLKGQAKPTTAREAVAYRAVRSGIEAQPCPRKGQSHYSTSHLLPGARRSRAGRTAGGACGAPLE